MGVSALSKTYLEWEINKALRDTQWSMVLPLVHTSTGWRFYDELYDSHLTPQPKKQSTIAYIPLGERKKGFNHAVMLRCNGHITMGSSPFDV
jgi:hypothetical protein